MSEQFSHKSVLLNEAVDALNVKPNGIYVDGTAGGGGHSYEIAKRLNGGRLIAIDRDPSAVKAATQRLGEFQNVTVVNARFSQINEILDSLKIDKIDGFLLDLGVSSHQLDTADRGFSYHYDAPLDMRMSDSGVSAEDLVNTLGERELSDIFIKYADERFAGRIARRIVEQRAVSPIDTTLKLASLVSECYPPKLRRDGHPARKVFQALRIAVNDEFGEEERALNDGFERLAAGGRFSVITFHSAEDRLVKQAFAAFCSGCTCPSDFPVCVCGKKPRAKQIFRKPVTAGVQELSDNPRSRSAKLRAVEKL